MVICLVCDSPPSNQYGKEGGEKEVMHPERKLIWIKTIVFRFAIIIYTHTESSLALWGTVKSKTHFKMSDGANKPYPLKYTTKLTH